METQNMTEKNADQDPRQSLDQDDLAEANRRASPQISVASGFTPGMAAGLCGIALLGLITFSSLAAERTSGQLGDGQANVAAAMPAAAVGTNGQPIIPVRAPERPPILLQASDSAPVYPPMTYGVTGKRPLDPAMQARLLSPVVAVDLPRSAGTMAATGPVKPNANAQGLAQSIAGEERNAAQAGRLANSAFTVPEGTVLAGTLETAINSDLPGHVRAVVSRNVTSFDGSKILIPKGSRLVGQYQSNLAVGQQRTFIVWERLIRPDGVTIALASPGTDSLGRAGVTGKVDTHFMRRFGAALLLSVIDAGSRAISSGNGNVVIAGGAGGAASAAGASLQNDVTIPPTIKVAQGTAIRIFLNRDLDFSDVG
jgi:type IV secretory pathway VirB10-like protein